MGIELNWGGLHQHITKNDMFVSGLTVLQFTSRILPFSKWSAGCSKIQSLMSSNQQHGVCMIEASGLLRMFSWAASVPVTLLKSVNNSSMSYLPAELPKRWVGKVLAKPSIPRGQRQAFEGSVVVPHYL